MPKRLGQGGFTHAPKPNIRCPKCRKIFPTAKKLAAHQFIRNHYGR